MHEQSSLSLVDCGPVRCKRGSSESQDGHDTLRANLDWEQTFNAVPDLVSIIDAHHTILRVNRAMAERCDLPPEALIGRKCHDVMHASCAPVNSCPHVKALRDGCVHTEQVEEKQLNGIFEVTVSPIRDHDGQLISCVHIARDITARKRSEAYRSMGQDILRVLNEKGDQKEAIQKVIALVKAAAGVDAVGIRLQDGDDFPYFYQEGFSQEFLQKENSLLARVRDGGICRDECGEVCLECTCGLVIAGKMNSSTPNFTDGGSCWTNDSFPVLQVPADEDPRSNPRNACIHQGFASVALIPIRAKGRIVGLLQLNDRKKGCFTLGAIEALEGIAENIGEAMLRKQAEEEKIRLEAQLQQAQKMESVGRLAGGVAHDFNNLLTVILGYAQMGLLELGPAHPFRANLEEILKAAQKSAGLTQQLLAFARKQTIAPRVLEVNETVENTLKMLRRLIGEDITIAWEPTNNLWQVHADPSQIDQILTNLCVNARDAISGVGKITIETGNRTFDREYCAAHAGVMPGEYVLLAVSDDGCGMDKETMAHIFEPFFTTKTVGKGTGLGLATVYGIVRQNNGFINSYSEPGFGTTFRIYLPRYEGAGRQAPPESAARPLAGGRETILLVEDDSSILNMTRIVLEAQGCRVLAANSTGEAINLAQEFSAEVRLLMTDVVMPGMNGRELARNLATLCPGIRCLFMSGYTANAIAHHGVLDEGVHFISKPFSLPDLAAKVREVLDWRVC